MQQAQQLQKCHHIKQNIYELKKISPDTVVDTVKDKVGSTVKTVEPVETPPTVAQPNPVLA